MNYLKEILDKSDGTRLGILNEFFKVDEKDFGLVVKQLRTGSKAVDKESELPKKFSSHLTPVEYASIILSNSIALQKLIMMNHAPDAFNGLIKTNQMLVDMLKTEREVMYSK